MTDPERPLKPRKRRIWAIALVVMAAVAIFATWRATSLSGLPDVGDPFDVAAYADAKVPDDRNAYTFYRHATKLLTKPPQNANYDWAATGAAEKKWLETNRQALDLWRRGTERPDALYIPPRDMTFATILPVIQELRTFVRGASLEGTRLEAAGDMDGALTWYIAMLRSGRHCGTRGVMIERLVGIALNQVACGHLNRWAADPRVDARMLRRAIDPAIAAQAMTRPTSEAYKTEYIAIMNSIDDPKMMTPEILGLATGQDRSGKADTPIQKAMNVEIPKILKREPERSRRVIRLIFANQLAYCDLPAAQQPPVAATFPSDYVPPSAATKPSPPVAGTITTLVGELYAVDASAPAAARALPPAEIARWWDSTLYAKLCMTTFANYHKAIARERSAQISLLANLRAELVKREHPQPVGAKPGDDRP